MGKSRIPSTGDKSPLSRPTALAGLATAMLAVAGCAGYPVPGGLAGQRTAYDPAYETLAVPAEPADPARQVAVAEIRAKADAAAAAAGNGTFPDVFQSYGPDGTLALTRAKRLAVEAELQAVLAAQAQAGNPAEAARLKARAEYLKRLAQQHGAQAEMDIEAASQAMDPL